MLCPSLLLFHFTFLFPLIIFILNFVFTLATTHFHAELLLFLPHPALQNQFSCQWSSHIHVPWLLKYLHSLPTFSSISLFVVDRVAVVALFQFYL